MFLVNIGSWKIKKLQVLICLKLFISGVLHKCTDQAFAVALPFLLLQTWEMWAERWGDAVCALLEE